MKLDVLLFGRFQSGPFFALLRKTGPRPCASRSPHRRLAGTLPGAADVRILYAALDQTVPGTLGGSVHVQAVAEGLAALRPRRPRRHAARRTRGPAVRCTWHAMGPPLGRADLRWTRASAVTALARRVGADVVMERYYNFGGEGVLAARALGDPRRARSQRAGHRLSRIAQGAARSRAARRADAPLARSDLPA